MQLALVVALRSISSLTFEEGSWGEARTQCLGQLWPWMEKRSGGHIFAAGILLKFQNLIGSHVIEV